MRIIIVTPKVEKDRANYTLKRWLSLLIQNWKKDRTNYSHKGDDSLWRYKGFQSFSSRWCYPIRPTLRLGKGQSQRNSREFFSCVVNSLNIFPKCNSSLSTIGLQIVSRLLKDYTRERNLTTRGSREKFYSCNPLILQGSTFCQNVPDLAK